MAKPDQFLGKTKKDIAKPKKFLGLTGVVPQITPTEASAGFPVSEAFPFPVPGIPTDIREILQSVPPIVPEIALGTAGAIFPPLRAARPIFKLLQRSIQAGAGGATGRLAGELAQEEPKSPEEIKREAQIAFALGATGEPVGQGVLRAGQFLGGKFIPPLVKGIKEAEETAGQFIPGKVPPFRGTFPPLTTAQRTEGRIFDILESFTESAIFRGRRFATLKGEVQPQMLTDFSDSIVNSIGRELPTQEAGKFFLESMKNKSRPFATLAKKLFEQVDTALGGTVQDVPLARQVEIMGAGGKPLVDKFGKPLTKTVIETTRQIVGGAKVDIRDIKRFAEQIAIKRGEKIQKVVPGTPGVRIIDEIASMPDIVPFSNAQFLRSQLLRRGRAEIPESGLADKLAGMVDGAIEVGGKKLSGKALEQFREASALWKDFKGIFHSDFAEKLATSHPSQVARAVFRSAPEQIQKARGLVSKEAFNDLLSAFMKDEVFGRSLPAIERQLGRGAPVAKSVANRWNLINSDLKKKMFSEEQLSNMNKWFRVADASQRKGEGLGGLMIALVQWGAAGSVVTGIAIGSPELVGSGSFVLIGPSLLSQLVTRRLPVRLMTEGFRIGAGDKAFAGASARLIAEVTRIAQEKGLEHEIQSNVGIETLEQLQQSAITPRPTPGLEAQ